ncbi:MAG: LuxR C-terminal-related transcriptional regulator [Solirubrobacteraceae bacterium]|nr:LuxR C-terminal-related transcriptional regulator [Solirubrobacteraceae bacterium]
MEWALTGAGAGAEAVSALRREVMAYLRRHAQPDSDFAAAEIVVAELLNNAFEHAPGPSWVRASWAGERPRLEVHDLGPGFTLDPKLPQPEAERGRGLFLVSAIADDVAVAAKPRRGSKMTVTLPVRRRVQTSHDPPRASGALPALEEAREDGTFGKEPFLRALTVELAQALEAREGPDAAEAVVAQVGANVGGRMEEAYRAARGVTARLSPEQIADLCVRLKGAIDGSFYVISADAEKIVLGNRTCPFGPVVQRQPGLCRMTSSVFGGIAARNSGRSAVVLEERIALGDPECRVVVWLGDHEPPDPAAAHRYLGPVDDRREDPALVDACLAAMHGRDFLYPEAVAAFMRDFLKRGEYVGGPKDLLTRREREIVTLIADSLTGKEIAEKLVISEKTVERHRGNILLKLGLRDRVALTRYAIRRGLVEA